MAELSSSSVYGNLAVTGEVAISGAVKASSFEGPLSGNAGTATKLTTPRKINGVDFDGSSNINLGTILSTTLDWNALTEPANYSVQTTLGTNRPATYHGTLVVSGTGQRVSHTFTTDTNPPLTYVRVLKNGSWEPWVQLANVSSNVASATMLATARTINGTSFNGTSNITTANWGSARNFTIGGATKSVNGSGNMAWSLAEIGALSEESYGMRPVLGTADLDLVRIPGLYGQAVHSEASLARNYPVEGVPGVLEVFSLDTTTTPFPVTTQRYTTNEAKQRVFIRRGGAQGAWGTWSEVTINGVTLTDIQTVTHKTLGAASKEGVTALGTVTSLTIDDDSTPFIEATVEGAVSVAVVLSAGVSRTAWIHCTDAVISWGADIKWPTEAPDIPNGWNCFTFSGCPVGNAFAVYVGGAQ